jgi:hypothetical protein
LAHDAFGVVEEEEAKWGAEATLRARFAEKMFVEVIDALLQLAA